MAKDLQKLISPTATAAYAWLAKPDEGQQYSDGKYKVTLLLEKKAKETKAFIKKLEAESNQSAEKEWGKIPKNLKYAYKDGDDTDKEEFAGHYMLVCKTKFRPGMVDCGDPVSPLPEGNEPHSGDLIRVSFALSPYKISGMIGVSAQLRNVQLVEKKNNGSGADEFESIDGGYSVAESGVANEEDF